jgi:subtilisin family serine protease
LDVFAPGTDVLSACGGANRCANPGDNAYARASGTSMAAPHVAGAAALYLSRRPSALPEEVAAALRAAATPGRLRGSMLPGTPNLLLYAGVAAPVAPPAVAAQAEPPAAFAAFAPANAAQ